MYIIAASLSQSLSNSSMSIIPWSYLLVVFSSPTDFRFLGCCYVTVMLITWCLLPWSSVVILSVTCHLSAWSSELKFQVTCYLSTWSSFMWVSLVTCYLSAWSSVTWSWSKVKNVNSVNNLLAVILIYISHDIIPHRSILSCSVYWRFFPISNSIAYILQSYFSSCSIYLILKL